MPTPRSHVIVTIAADGAVQLDARGYSGKSCADATEFLEQALGQRTSERKKPEWYSQSSARLRRDHEQQQGGAP